MLTLNTPYLHVQAMRRQLRDKGIPTRARPYLGYKAVCNAADGNQNTTARGNVEIDADSYFVWLSTYYYWQSVAWVDYAAIGHPAEAEDGFAMPIRVRIVRLRTGRRFHSTDHMGIFLFDWFQASNNVVGVTTPGGELEDGEVGTTQALHIFRAFWPEPILLEPEEEIQFETINDRVAAPPMLGTAHVFFLAGVRLYPGRV